MNLRTSSLIAALALLSGCAQEATADPATPTPAQTPTLASYSDPSDWDFLSYSAVTQAEHYEDVATMAENSTVVVEAGVTRTAPTRVVGREGEDPGVQYYGLELDVERVLAGNPWNDDKIVVETMGAPAEDAQLQGTFFLVHKMDRMIPGVPRPAGDPQGDENYYRFISSQGVLIEADQGRPVFATAEEIDLIHESVTGQTYDEVIASM